MVCINPPEFFLAKRGSDFAGQWMLGLLGIGLICLSMNLRKIMLISFLGSAAIAFFLKTESNENLVLPSKTSLPKITVAHVNLASLTDDLDELIAVFDELEVDFISFQEVTPDWNFILKKKLNQVYPFSKSIVRADFYGMAVYSKIPLFTTENYIVEGKPNLYVSLSLGNKRPYIFSTYSLPPINRKTREEATNHLGKVAERIAKIDGPVISLGDFNMTYWSNEIRSFRQTAKLENSRRNITLNSFGGPYSHIFYSNDFECVFFQEVRNKEQNSIGIVGTYQFKSGLPIN